MSFQKQLDVLIVACKAYQKEVESKDLLFKEPYQSKYLAINDLLNIYESQRAAIENAAAAEADKNAPHYIDLSASRKKYHLLKKEIPPFLANGPHYYFYLQGYYVECMQLLKSFSYTTFRGDFDKIRNLGNWLAFLRETKEKHDTEGSIKKSMEDIKKMGDFTRLDPKGLQQLQAEVHNIQTLLKESPDAIDALTAEDSELLNAAAQYIKENGHLLKALPPINTDFVLEDTPVLETTAYRCQQLIVQADAFPDEHPKAKKVTHIYEFKQLLKDSFDLSIPICADIHATIEKVLGSQKQLSIHKLCKIIHRALEPFINEKDLQKRYGALQENYSGMDIDLGTPDTSILADILCAAIGEKPTD